MDIKHRYVNTPIITTNSFLSVGPHGTGLERELVFCSPEEPGSVRGAQCQIRILPAYIPELGIVPWPWDGLRSWHRFYAKSCRGSVERKNPVDLFCLFVSESGQAKWGLETLGPVVGIRV